MSFIKWHSAENHYREREIAKELEKNPELKDCLYAVTEKLDGANFQVIITPEDIKFASRNQVLGDGADFYGYQTFVAPYIKAFTRLQLTSHTYNFFGELFGEGIQKRIGYANKELAFFGAYKDGVLLPFKEFQELCLSWLPTVPCLHIGKLEECLAYNIDVESHYARFDAKNKRIEGVVITPFDISSTFSIKKKQEGFSDIRSNSIPLSNGCTYLQATFNCYVTQNRLLDLFSKLGVIPDKSQIGQYIAAFIEDAKVDFLKDFQKEFSELPEDEKSKVFKKGGNKVYQLLQEYINE